MAEAVAAAWGTGAGPLRLVADRENRVYEMRLQDGRRLALRLHRPGYQSRAAIEGEIAWTAALAARGFPCAAPVPTRDGRYLVEGATGEIATAVAWVDAPPIARLLETGAPLGPVYRRLGAVLAELHNLSDAGAAQGTEARTAWDRDGLTGPDPWWGRYWENPVLSDSEAREMLRYRDRARDWLGAMRDPDMGAIHADAITENVLGEADALWLIDFDDSGTGYRIYDLGVALVPHWNRADCADLETHIAEGYAATRGVDAEKIKMLLRGFTALRALASAGWIIPRAAADDPKQRRFVDRALGCARRAFG